MTDNKKFTINIAQLRARCIAKIDDFASEGVVTDTLDGMLVYKDNGANILGIAHLDTVQDSNHFHHSKDTGGSVVYSTALDNRLGAHLLLDVLPAAGINIDVLLTEGEEIGRSTAAHFEIPEGKDYNWIFSFDRAGMDVVMYDYETPELTEIMTTLGIEVGIGSFSDICFMEHLNIAGFNFGCGSYAGHSPYSHAILDHTFKMLKQFKTFYNSYANTHLEHVPVYTTPTFGNLGWWNRYSPNGDESKWYEKLDYSTQKTKKYYEKLDGSIQTSMWDIGIGIDCMVCGEPYCYGVAHCEHCKIQFHDNESIHFSGYCYKCVNLASSIVSLVFSDHRTGQNIEKDKEFEFEFTNLIDWNHGDFDDEGSCYWTEKTVS